MQIMFVVNSSFKQDFVITQGLSLWANIAKTTVGLLNTDVGKWDVDASQEEEKTVEDNS